MWANGRLISIKREIDQRHRRALITKKFRYKKVSVSIRWKNIQILFLHIFQLLDKPAACCRQVLLRSSIARMRVPEMIDTLHIAIVGSPKMCFQSSPRTMMLFIIPWQLLMSMCARVRLTMEAPKGSLCGRHWPLWRPQSVLHMQKTEIAHPEGRNLLGTYCVEY